MSGEHVQQVSPAIIIRLKRAEGHLRYVIRMLGVGQPGLNIGYDHPDLPLGYPHLLECGVAGHPHQGIIDDLHQNQPMRA